MVEEQKSQTLKPIFKKASTLPKLTLGIPQLDSLLHFLSLNQKICIKGAHAQKIIERVCVRAQLPFRYGGLDTRVLLIDGANCSDLYQCVDFAQQYGLDVRNSLKGIISSRAFTVYQLANLITCELNSAIQKYNTKVIVITQLLHFFTNDPYLNKKEMQRILKEIVKSLESIEDCLVVVSLGGVPTEYDELILKLFTKVIQINPSYHTLSIRVNDNGMQRSTFIKKDELETVQN